MFTQSSFVAFGVRIMMPSHFPAILLISAICVGDHWVFSGRKHNTNERCLDCDDKPADSDKTHNSSHKISPMT